MFVAPPCGKYNIKNNNNSVRENQIKKIKNGLAANGETEPIEGKEVGRRRTKRKNEEEEEDTSCGNDGGIIFGSPC